MMPGRPDLLAALGGLGDLGGVEALAGDGWIRLRKPWSGAVSPGDLIAVLRAGDAMPGGARLVLDEVGELYLEGETPASEEDEGADPAGEIQALAGRMASLISLPPDSPAARRPPPDGVAEMLRAGGAWCVHERSDGLVVDIDTRDGLIQVRLQAREADLLAELEVLRGESPWGDCSLAALAVLLLSESGRVRLVRACNSPAGAAHEAWFQVALPLGRLSPARLRDALGALALAWDEIAEEATVLQSPVTAARYLAKRGFAVVPD